MYKTGIGYSEAVREFEKGFILTVLQGQKGNQVRAAQDLGMHRNTLRRMIHCLQIDIQPIRAVARRRPPQHPLLDSPKKTERALQKRLRTVETQVGPKPCAGDASFSEALA